MKNNDYFVQKKIHSSVSVLFSGTIHAHCLLANSTLYLIHAESCIQLPSISSSISKPFPLISNIL